MPAATRANASSSSPGHPLGEKTDAVLLAEFSVDGNEAAFREITRRHLDLVYSAALRRCGGDAAQAQDITQHVFCALATQAGKLSRHPALCAWLYTTVRNIACNIRLADERRRKRELDAVSSGIIHSSASGLEWDELREVLDLAMDELAPADRTAVLLRYFERRSYREVGVVLNLSENTARMRTERSLEKLRGALAKHKIYSTAAALGSTLVLHAVVPAPVHILTTVAASAWRTTASYRGPAQRRRTIRLTQVAVATALLVTGIVLVAVRHRFDPLANNSRSIPEMPLATTPGSFAPRETTVTQASTDPAYTSHSRLAIPPLRTLATAGARKAEPAEILRQMATAYASLQTYQDTGEVLSRFRNTTSPQKIKFQLTFARPSSLRLEWSPSDGQFTPPKGRAARIVGKDNQALYDLGYGTQPPVPASPLVAIVIGCAPSNGCAYHIPKLLIDGSASDRYFSPAKIRDPEMLDEQEIENVRCYVIRGLHPLGAPYTLWIGKRDFLLRKIVTTKPLSSLNVGPAPRRELTEIEEIHREIMVDREISPETFELPPAARP